MEMRKKGILKQEQEEKFEKFQKRFSKPRDDEKSRYKAHNLEKEEIGKPII